MAKLSQNRAILGAFYTQYVALLLIVLSALIGSSMHSSSHFSVASNVVPEDPRIPEQRRVVESEITRQRLPDDLFSRRGDVVESNGALLAIASVAGEHDVRLEFVLSSPSDDRNFTTSDRRVQALDDFLVRRGVPPSAFRIWRADRASSPGSYVTMYRQRWRGSVG